MEEPRGQEEMKKKKDSKKAIILTLIILLLLLFSVGIGVVLVSQRTTFFGRALGPLSRGEISLENSYVFASPLVAQANGKEKIRVTVFVLDTEGKGVEGKPVFLGLNERLEINPVQAVTDNLGRAIFDIATTSPAEYLIEARVENRVLSQRVKVSFR